VAEISGTRRYPVGRTFDEASLELEAVAAEAAAALGVEAAVSINKSGQPFRLAEDAPIVAAVRQSYQEVTGSPLVVSGMRYSGDVSQFANVGGIPAIYHGTDQATAHADVESVPCAALVRCARVLIGATLYYLGLPEGTQDDQ
jgi:acetylornithine deacetylase/succinyl-diaminopimelate desuccinylase-like protein